MGVIQLWQILEPVKVTKKLQDLRGMTLAVDLSAWIVDSNSVKQMHGAVVKPHLRNLFFRIQHLLELEITPVFVLEGRAPELKLEALAKRNQTRYGARGCSARSQCNRSQLARVVRECCEMLDYLGLQYVASAGEAEAMCAFLNQEKLVGACITQDGDAFLYGAQTVVRNFTVSGKEPVVEVYSMEDVEEKLNLNRERLVGLALLLGCDYNPKGVPGVGKEQAMKLIQGLAIGESLLQRFVCWRSTGYVTTWTCEPDTRPPSHCGRCGHSGSSRDHAAAGCDTCRTATSCRSCDVGDQCPCDWHVSKSSRDAKMVELVVCRKARRLANFPDQKIIDEFLRCRNDKPRKNFQWSRPQLEKLWSFNLESLTWPETYTTEKVVPLVTLWDMRHIRSNGMTGRLMKPIRIVKRRIRQGVPCYEVQWEKLANDSYTEADHYVTVEEQSLVDHCFPNLVAMFQTTYGGKMGRKGKAKKIVFNKDLVDELSTRLDRGLNLNGATDTKVDGTELLSGSNKSTKTPHHSASSPSQTTVSINAYNGNEIAKNFRIPLNDLVSKLSSDLAKPERILTSSNTFADDIAKDFKDVGASESDEEYDIPLSQRLARRRRQLLAANAPKNTMVAFSSGSRRLGSQSGAEERSVVSGENMGAGKDLVVAARSDQMNAAVGVTKLNTRSRGDGDVVHGDNLLSTSPEIEFSFEPSSFAKRLHHCYAFSPNEPEFSAISIHSIADGQLEIISSDIRGDRHVANSYNVDVKKMVKIPKEDVLNNMSLFNDSLATEFIIDCSENCETLPLGKMEQGIELNDDSGVHLRVKVQMEFPCVDAAKSDSVKEDQVIFNSAENDFQTKDDTNKRECELGGTLPLVKHGRIGEMNFVNGVKSETEIGEEEKISFPVDRQTLDAELAARKKFENNWKDSAYDNRLVQKSEEEVTELIVLSDEESISPEGTEGSCTNQAIDVENRTEAELAGAGNESEIGVGFIPDASEFCWDENGIVGRCTDVRRVADDLSVSEGNSVRNPCDKSLTIPPRLGYILADESAVFKKSDNMNTLCTAATVNKTNGDCDIDVNGLNNHSYVDLTVPDVNENNVVEDSIHGSNILQEDGAYYDVQGSSSFMAVVNRDHSETNEDDARNLQFSNGSDSILSQTFFERLESDCVTPRILTHEVESNEANGLVMSDTLLCHDVSQLMLEADKLLLKKRRKPTVRKKKPKTGLVAQNGISDELFSDSFIQNIAGETQNSIDQGQICTLEEVSPLSSELSLVLNKRRRKKKSKLSKEKISAQAKQYDAGLCGLTDNKGIVPVKTCSVPALTNHLDVSNNQVYGNFSLMTSLLNFSHKEL